MHRKARVSIAILLALSLLAIACRGSAPTSPEVGAPAVTEPAVVQSPSDSGPAETAAAAQATQEVAEFTNPLLLEPNPANISITLDQNTAVTAEIGPEGGVLETVDARGTFYKLIIPEGALVSAEAIRMTPIASAAGDVLGDTFLAGASFLPEGLHFLKLVTLEISGAVIAADAVGFATERGGQDIHLKLSTQNEATVTLKTTHFSEMSVALLELLETLQGVTPSDDGNMFEQALAANSPAVAMITLQFWYSSLQEKGGLVETYQDWETWTTEVNTLLRMTGLIASTVEWDDDTVEFAVLLENRQSLYDQWVGVSDQIAHSLGEHCLDGHLEDAMKLQLIRRVVLPLSLGLELAPSDVRQSWANLSQNCTNLGLTWQANVVTSGSGFFSDISLGAEQSPLDWNSETVQETLLVIEYIDGAFSDCATSTGDANLEANIELEIPNLQLGLPFTEPTTDIVGVEDIIVHVTILSPVDIDCNVVVGGLIEFPDVLFPFHGGALEEVNKPRLATEGGWEFELDYDPGGGLVAQFEEGPETYPFDGGSYQLWQLISLYVIQPEPLEPGG
jgi:hypothetical protein